jgi:hypothetical protein
MFLGRAFRLVFAGVFGLAALALPQASWAGSETESTEVETTEVDDGEDYPIEAPGHVLDPIVCANGRIEGFAEGAEPGTIVQFAGTFTLKDGTTSTFSLSITVAADTKAPYTQAFPVGAKSVKVTSSGKQAGNLAPFTITVSADLSKCSKSGSLVLTGSDNGPWVRVGVSFAMVGAGLIVIAARRRREQDRLRPVTARTR